MIKKNVIKGPTWNNLIGLIYNKDVENNTDITDMNQQTTTTVVLIPNLDNISRSLDATVV